MYLNAGRLHLELIRQLCNFEAAGDIELQLHHRLQDAAYKVIRQIPSRYAIDSEEAGELIQCMYELLEDAAEWAQYEAAQVTIDVGKCDEFTPQDDIDYWYNKSIRSMHGSLDSAYGVKGPLEWMYKTFDKGPLNFPTDSPFKDNRKALKQKIDEMQERILNVEAILNQQANINRKRNQVKKQKPNERCACGSGKKYKKCHGQK